VLERRLRIIEKILKNCDVDIATGCWLWRGPDSGNGKGGGYPRMSLDGCTVAVHRVIYTCFNGYVPNKRQLDHTCTTRRCVNPTHLEIVTNKRNSRLRVQREKETRKCSVGIDGADGPTPETL
jgi:hypothetical protein